MKPAIDLIYVFLYYCTEYAVVWFQLLSMLFGVYSAYFWGVSALAVRPLMKPTECVSEMIDGNRSLQYENGGTFFSELYSYVSDLWKFRPCYRWIKIISTYPETTTGYISYTNRLNKNAALSAMFSMLCISLSSLFPILFKLVGEVRRAF